ncbi:36153_t:CDS:2 [Racocetra persica]|uniref:36153_t:CDS:1 n=1 Tax=Racocetra persica TaxID=160502 RepID=A0ACA9NPP4_9GLOM|nr:36153_t:CDS:2 [Racocetra persica]
MLKFAKIISGHSNKKKKEDISALRKSADTLKDYSDISIVDKIDQTNHANSSILNQIDVTSTDNNSNVESSTYAVEDPVWSTIEWNVQSFGIDEASIITSNVWNDDNQQQVRNIRNINRKDGILRDDFEENVWADVQIVSSIPGSSFTATELSNNIVQSVDNKTPLTLHEKVGQFVQETLRNQELLTPPCLLTPPNMENVPLFPSTKESIGPKNRSVHKNKTINYKGYSSEIDQMDHFNVDVSFGLSIRSSFDDLLTKSTKDDKDSTYNANVDRCENLVTGNKKIGENISSELKESIDFAGYSYIEDTKISEQEVNHEGNLARTKNIQNDIMFLENCDIINNSDDFEVLNNEKSRLGLAINFDHLGSPSDMASLWITVLGMPDNSKTIYQSIDEMSPSIEDLVYSAQESLDARLTWMSIIETWDYKNGAGFSWRGSQIQSLYLKSILPIYRIGPANKLPASELLGDKNIIHSPMSVTSINQTSDKVTILNDNLSEGDVDVKQDDSDVSENSIEFNQDSSVSASEFSLLDCINSQTAIVPASLQKSDIIFGFEELIGLDFTTEHPSLAKKIDDSIKLQKTPDQFQMFIEFANGNMDSQSSLHLYDHETNSSFTSISSDFGEFVSAENVQAVSEHSSSLSEFEEIVSSVNDDNSTLKQDTCNNSPESTSQQDTCNNSPESTSQQDTWMSLSDLSFLEYITISSRKPHQDLLLDFNNFISLKSTTK